jgi:hypothetical protein
VATDAAGDVFVANRGNNTVEEFSASGALVRTLSSGISSPARLATDAAGDVFVANQGNSTVEEFSASGALLRTLSSGVSYPASVATDAAGDVFVANQDISTVEEFSASGALLRTLSSGISSLASLATDAAGDVFVANEGNNTVEEFSASGALVRTLSSGVSGPTSLATDAAGDVFVANQGNSTVEEFSASGALVGTLSSGVSSPYSLATDAAGDVFVANQGNSTVEEFNVSQLTSVSNATTQVAVTQVAMPQIPPTLTLSVLQTASTASVVVGGTIDVADAFLTVSIYDGSILLGTTTPDAQGVWSAQVTLPSTAGAQSITAQVTDATPVVVTSNAISYQPLNPNITTSLIVVPGGGSVGYIAGFDAAGDFAGIYSDISGNNSTAFIDKSGVFTPITYPGSKYLGVIGIDAKGDVLADSYDPSNGTTQAFFIYSANGVVQTFAAPTGATNFYVNSIDAAGDVFGYYSSNTASLVNFEIAAGSSTPTPLTIAGLSNIGSISADSSGDLYGSYFNSATGQQAGFVDFVGGALTTIVIPNATGVFVIGANAAGYIWGTYTAASGGYSNNFVDYDGVLTTISVPGAQSGSTYINGVTTAGLVYGQYSSATAGYVDFIEQNGVYQTESITSVAPTFVMGQGGGVVAGEYSSYNEVPFIYQNGGYTPLQIPGADMTIVNGVAPTGAVFGQYETYQNLTFVTHGFVDVNGTVTTVDIAGYDQSMVAGVDAAGDELIDANNFATNAFVVEIKSAKGTVTTLPTTGATSAVGLGIAADGSAVFGQVTLGATTEGFVYNVGAQTVTLVSDPNASSTAYAYMPGGTAYAYLTGGMSNFTGTSLVGADSAGNFYGDYVAADSSIHAFIDTNGVFTDFNAPGAATTMIISVSVSGVITGAYQTAAGAEYGFVDNAGVVTTYRVPNVSIPLGLSGSKGATVYGLVSDANSSSLVELTTAPTLTIASAGAVTAQASLTLNGTIDAADSGLTVSIYDGSTLLGTVVPSAGGAWSKSVTLLPTLGAQSITAQAKDAAGNVGVSNALFLAREGGQTITFPDPSGDAASLYGTSNNWDYVYGSNGTIEFNDAQANVSGGGDAINFVGSTGNVVSIYATGGNTDSVSGSYGFIALTASQANVTGGGDTIALYASGDIAALIGTNNVWDYVYGSNATITFNNAQANVSGGGNTLNFVGSAGNLVSLYATAGVADAINGSNGAINMTNAQTSATGNNNSVYFYGNNTLTANGTSDFFVFQSPIGLNTINGFDPTDTLQFNASDFANWNALLSHMSQSGADTVISLDPSDTVTLTGVTAANLTAAQFKFV